ncbi:MAG: extracellular solute-binding protein [Planctomycetota bacterium]
MPGRPFWLCVVLATVGATLLLVSPTNPTTGPVVWAFAPTHADTYRDLDVADVRLMQMRAIDLRLLTADGPELLPDVVEIEVNHVDKHITAGRLLPLNMLLERDGLLGEFPPSTLSAWSRDGIIHGVPQDVHPVTLTYRRDLFDAAGVDLESPRTWDELAAALRTYTAATDKPALELPTASASHLRLMLLQRGTDVTDDNATVDDTIDFYASLVRDGVATDASAGPVGWVQDLERGDLGAFLTPDWRIAYLETDKLRGKLAMRPLPIFEPGDTRTSVWGGTMLGIPADHPDPDAAWAVLKQLLLTDAALEARFRHTRIVPADKAGRAHPALARPNAWFGEQRIGLLYADLADEVPGRAAGPDVARGSAALTAKLIDAQR